MTDTPEHKAEGPEEEITSEGFDVLAEQAVGAPPLGHAPDARAASDDDATDAEPDKSQEQTETPKLERLQKILAQAGIASRRHAEELITQGRVQVNGQVVTTLGSKANPARDHIRVDGKLLQGAERHRYFVLNKPRGYVTTVSDPEGRPTVMQFFAKMGERLYPVGRLDYQSEGLLLVTNDGELANRLTQAASGVEKTYLVKVAGKPSEEMMNRVRQGLSIDRGKPGQGRVRTASAQVRPIRVGPNARSPRTGPRADANNPWYEVVLIEGRNRELRKIFEEVGHHVEKIRRVGYGPLKLDIEPGKFRELQPKEVAELRRVAEGKLHSGRLNTNTMPGQGAGKKNVPEKEHSGDRRGRTNPGAYKPEGAQPGRKFPAAGEPQKRVERGPRRPGETRPFAGAGQSRQAPFSVRATEGSGKPESRGAKPLKGNRFGSRRGGPGSSKAGWGNRQAPFGARTTEGLGKTESGGAKPLKGNRFGSRRGGPGSSKPQGNRSQPKFGRLNTGRRPGGARRGGSPNRGSRG